MHLKNHSTPPCYQYIIVNSTNSKLIEISEPYSNRTALNENLRDNIDRIGNLICDSDQEASYLGDVDYKPGEEFHDAKERWDFNRTTLLEWIEIAIANGSYYGPVVEICINQKRLCDQYIPQHKVMTLEYPMTTKEQKTHLGDQVKQLIFTTSSDIADSVILTFDLESKEITISEYQTGDCQTKILETEVDDLFDQDFLPQESVIASNLRFHYGNIKRLVQEILDFIVLTHVKVTDYTLAIEVKTDHFGSIYGMSGDLRSLTCCEFLHHLIGLLNIAWFKIYREHLLVQETYNDPDWDDVPADERTVSKPHDIYTVLRLNVDGLCDVSTFSSRSIALSRVQEQINEICLGYPKVKIPIKQRTFDEDECCWQTMDGLNHVFLYQTELIDE